MKCPIVFWCSLCFFRTSVFLSRRSRGAVSVCGMKAVPLQIPFSSCPLLAVGLLPVRAQPWWQTPGSCISCAGPPGLGTPPGPQSFGETRAMSKELISLADTAVPHPLSHRAGAHSSALLSLPQTRALCSAQGFSPAGVVAEGCRRADSCS